jgi:hypothetical protein
MQLQQIAEDRVPFSVKGCGHSVNPGFSSTTGVHIVDRCVQISRPKGFNVFGGRLDGVGEDMRVAGYSRKTNEYVVMVDSVTEFYLVSLNGL